MHSAPAKRVPSFWLLASGSWKLVYARFCLAGFYFDHVIRLCSEVVFAKRYDVGCNVGDREGINNKYTIRIVPFSVTVLAVVTSKVDVATCMIPWRARYPSR